MKQVIWRPLTYIMWLKNHCYTILSSRTWLSEESLTPNPTQYRSFRRRNLSRTLTRRYQRMSHSHNRDSITVDRVAVSVNGNVAWRPVCGQKTATSPAVYACLAPSVRPEGDGPPPRPASVSGGGGRVTRGWRRRRPRRRDCHDVDVRRRRVDEGHQRRRQRRVDRYGYRGDRRHDAHLIARPPCSITWRDSYFRFLLRVVRSACRPEGGATLPCWCRTHFRSVQEVEFAKMGEATLNCQVAINAVENLLSSRPQNKSVKDHQRLLLSLHCRPVHQTAHA